MTGGIPPEAGTAYRAAPYAPEPGPPARRGRVGLVLGIVGIAVVLGVGGFAAASVAGPATDLTSEPLVFEPQASRLAVDVGAGTITIGRATGSRVEVTRTVRSRGAEPVLTETNDANGVRLAAKCEGGPLTDCTVDYDIRVPDGFALDVETGSGTVEASGVTAGSVAVHVSSGDVRLVDVHGPVQVESSSGDVSGERLDSPTVSATTSSGEVELDLATAPQDLTVEASSGGVTVALPAGQPYRVEIDTSSGDEAVEVPTDPSAASAVKVDTSSGDVTVRAR